MTRAIALVALVGLAFALRSFQVPAPHGVEAAMLLGFTLVSAYVAGAVAASAGLPRLTGYVLVGIVIGPDAIAVLTPDMVESLRTIDEIALALIALTAGGELKTGELKRTLRPILGIGLGIFVLVTLGIMLALLLARPLIPFFAEQPIGVTVAVALLLGIWSANSSPDATIAVINETDAHGDVTETILGTTVLKDVLVIMAFAAALSVAGPLVDPDAAFDSALLIRIGWEVGGAGIVGAVAGFGLAIYLERIGTRTVFATLVFTYVLTLLAHGLHTELLLTAVAAGFVIENYSTAGDRLIDAIERNSLVVFAIFFALAGAALSLDALADYWLAGLAIVLLRGGLTYAGGIAGARAVGAPPEITRLAWRGLISQAGVTLGLSLLVARQFPSWGNTFVAVTTAAIIVHLLIGPILLKRALEEAGETDYAEEPEAATSGAAVGG